MKKLWRKFKWSKDIVLQWVEQKGLSKREIGWIMGFIFFPAYAHVPFIPTGIAAVYVIGRVLYIQISKSNEK